MKKITENILTALCFLFISLPVMASDQEKQKDKYHTYAYENGNGDTTSYGIRNEDGEIPLNQKTRKGAQKAANKMNKIDKKDDKKEVMAGPNGEGDVNNGMPK